MRKIYRTAFLIALVGSSSLWAQPLPAEAQNEPISCAISLPYRPEQISDCSPQAAAAYDFAFCALTYDMVSHLAPPSDKNLRENSQSEAFKQKSLTLAHISALLSDVDTLQKNTELTKKYYESMNGKEGRLISSSVDYVLMKCKRLNASHGEVLLELAKKLNIQPKEAPK